MKNLLVVVIAIVTSLVLAEAAVRIIAPQDLSGSWLQASGRGYMVNKSDGSARHQLGKQVVYYHFYKPHLRATPVKPAKLRVLVVGDSFTFGWLLSWKQTYVSQLQEKADQEFGPGKVQFLNAAAGGWGAEDYLAYVEQFGAQLKPDVVLVFLNTDDIGRSVKRGIYQFQSKQGLALKTNFKEQKPSKLKQILNKVPVYDWMLSNSALLQLTRKVYLALAVYHHKIKLFEKRKVEQPALAGDGSLPLPQSRDIHLTPQQAQRLGASLFHRLHQWCRQHHAKLLVTTTGFDRYYNNKNDPTYLFLQKAPQVMQREGIAYYDYSPQFKRAVRGHVIQLAGDPHPNAYATEVIAQMVWPWLRGSIPGQFNNSVN